MRRGSLVRRARAALLLPLVPFLLAAADPTADAAPCGSGTRSGEPPDLVEARGEIVELGTSARWTLAFAEPLRVPDAHGRPFRVDVVIHDPGAPVFDVGLYRDVNRIVRFDATRDPTLGILLLPEGASNVFSPPMIEDRTMMIQVPGRILSDENDETGTSPGLAKLRWSVIVRDEGSCDVLGEGRPVQRLVRAARPHQGAAGPAGRSPAEWVQAALALGVAAIAGVAVGAVSYVRRSRSR
jgi:hypothetical protein